MTDVVAKHGVPYCLKIRKDQIGELVALPKKPFFTIVADADLDSLLALNKAGAHKFLIHDQPDGKMTDWLMINAATEFFMEPTGAPPRKMYVRF